MRPSTSPVPGRLAPAFALVLIAVTLTGCGTLARAFDEPLVEPRFGVPVAGSSVVPLSVDYSVSPPVSDRASDGIARATGDAVSVIAADEVTLATLPAPDLPGRPALAAGVLLASANDTAVDAERPLILVAQAQPKKPGSEEDEYELEEYDPWERFNETMFDFNYRLDKNVLKPVARVWDKIVPDGVQRALANAFDNLGAPKRMLNSLFQRKWDGAVRELGRFMLNTVVGIGGLFDGARHEGIEKSREDFGQTLGFYGVSPGPYVVLPFFEPMTVRDGIGKGVDSLMDPLGYFISIPFAERIVIKLGEVVNERSLNLELFEGFEEGVIDLYSAVRHAYLERRRNLIKE